MKVLSHLLLLITASCSAVESVERNWSFIEKVGGLEIGKPYKELNTNYLPINVDVSGLKKVTTKPTTLNSALMCSRTGHIIKDNEIHISIYTSLINETAGRNCKSIPLLGIKEGKYTVYYSTKNTEKHKLGSITI